MCVPFPSPDNPAEWLASGTVAFPRMLGLIGAAVSSVRLEVFIFTPGQPGDSFLAALVAAAERGVTVRVLLDAFGSGNLPGGYWHRLERAGGQVRTFNPLRNLQALVRDHRKMLVCDESAAVVGGFNIGAEYDGDGITTGWRDNGVLLWGSVAVGLAQLFDLQFGEAEERQPWTARWRRREDQSVVPMGPKTQVLPVTPGRGRSCLTGALLHDLGASSEITLVSPYFLPPPVLRRALRRAARRGARVRVIVPAQSDVRMVQVASRRLYAGLLRHEVEIWEYEPRILHAKVFLCGDVLYVGSSNLDPRSLHLNFEVMVRLVDAGIVASARADVADMLMRSRRVDPSTWGRSRGIWAKIQEGWAFWILYRIDPWVTGRFVRRES